MRKHSRKDVEGELEYAQLHNPELKRFHLNNSDGRLGKLVCLAEKLEGGSLDVRSDFMTYDVMVGFLRGYCYKGEERYKLNKS